MILVLIALFFSGNLFADYQSVVQRGDSITKILSKSPLSASEVKYWVYQSPLTDTVGNIVPGDLFKVKKSDGNTHIIYRTRSGKIFKFIKLKDKVVISTPDDNKPVQRYFKSFTITNSLTVDGKKAGLSYNLLQAIADVYAWDLDFKRDLRKGDRIEVVYEQKKLTPDYVGESEVVFARITNKGKKLEAIRYIDEAKNVGYYNQDGQALSRNFLRKPLVYKRISSPFSMHRSHPVFGGVRPHTGVDLAAKQGTPVWAPSAGTVIFAGNRGGYGKAIIIKHGSRVTTLYGHLSQIAPGIKKGAHVAQRQVIGKVGQTGVATGPHLHYEFRIDNKPMDPMAIDLPRSKSLTGKALSMMLLERQNWLVMAQDGQQKI
jgi:murein DD-endopeptidase MepM/ murein hydrolase activator NlpD